MTSFPESVWDPVYGDPPPGDGNLACFCSPREVSDDSGRPLEPLEVGDIRGIRAHLLYPLKCVVEEKYRDEITKLRGRSAKRSSAPASRASSRGRPKSARSATSQRSGFKKHRPCVIWDVTHLKEGDVDVFLMGTFDGSSFDDLPEAVKNYVVGVYVGEHVDDYSELYHIHTSPPWGAPSSSWLIPLRVTVSVDRLVVYNNDWMDQSTIGPDSCPYINAESMKVLGTYHSDTVEYMDKVMTDPERLDREAYLLWEGTWIKRLFTKEGAEYSAELPAQRTKWAYIGVPSSNYQSGSRSSSSRSSSAFEGRRRSGGSFASEWQSIEEEHADAYAEQVELQLAEHLESLNTEAQPAEEAPDGDGWTKVERKSKKSGKWQKGWKKLTRRAEAGLRKAARKLSPNRDNRPLP
ncbi:hypothetical protein FB107DRAFT_218936 [Schizophyllum commune]